MLLVITLILPISALAECETGFSWESTGSQCVEWSTPTCTQYEWQCVRRVWGVCVKYNKVCTAYSEPVCLQDEEVGQCVANPVEPVVEAPKQSGGISWLQLVPRVNEEVYQYGRVFMFLTQNTGKAGLLFKAVENDNAFAQDAYGGMREEFALLGANNLYGYDHKIEAKSDNVLHTVLVNLPAGQYKMRAYYEPSEGVSWSNGITFNGERLVEIK